MLKFDHAVKRLPLEADSLNQSEVHANSGCPQQRRGRAKGREWIALLLTLAVTGCGVGVVSPSRSAEPGAFITLVTGKVRPANFQATTDCVMDGLDSNRMIIEGSVRQQRRVGGYRVEEVHTMAVMSSVDISETGDVKLTVWKAGTGLISTKKQEAAVQSCIDKFSAMQ